MASRDLLLSNPSDEKLEELKNIYDTRFTKSGKMRNLISLFLYVGTCIQDWTYEQPYIFFRPRIHVAQLKRLSYQSSVVNSNAGIIYTGDGYLKNTDQIMRFITAMTMKRLGGDFVLQVMHHGSRNNSHPKIAATLSPFASVYCSDPNNQRFRHPHIEVRNQFERYNPMQVNLKDGVKITIHVHRNYGRYWRNY